MDVTGAANPIAAMMSVLVAEGRQFFPELLPPRLAHVGRDRFFPQEGTSDDYDNENELAFVAAAE